MKKIVSIVALACVMALSGVSALAAPTSFAGTWELDKAKSEGLSRGMQNAESVTLTVTQDAKQITIDTKMAGGQGGAGGPGGVGGPGGGQGRGMGMGGAQTYNLDGTETSTDMPNGGNAKNKATWSSDGKTLTLTRVIHTNFQGNEVTITNTDVLTLSADGKTLTIARTSESARGTQQSKLVFNKK